MMKKMEGPLLTLVLLPGFQKGRDIVKASQGKGQGAVFGQKKAICIV
jgi:hypothetical protein